MEDSNNLEKSRGHGIGNKQADRSRERQCALKRSTGDSRWWGLLWTKILWDLQRESNRHKPLQIPSARNRPKRAVGPPSL